MLGYLAATVALLLALPLAARADPQDRLVRDYTRFAGSEANAESLVNGLRNDQPIELSSDGRTTTFAPPTRKMGNGNVEIALKLATSTLADQGIRNPTPEQIRAALNGGTVTTRSGERVALPGVLELRASGMGWGRIAQDHGFKLGELMRHDGHHARAPGDFQSAKLERPERVHGFERPERPQRPERPERHHHQR